MIRIVLSSDAVGFSRNATLIASILRRTEASLEVRFYTRGFEACSFRQGRLSVDFRRCDAPVTGAYPGHVPEAVFDRLRIITDEREWDRVLVMDHDMVALCDLATYFDEDFDGNLLMGRLFGPGNTLGLQMINRGGLPAPLRHCESYPYFYMGPMMNLAAMRHEGIWERLLEAHEMIGQDEQISLTAACGGRVKGVDKRWNLVPEWDKLEELSAEAGRDPEKWIEGMCWRKGVPSGVVHWTGGNKPWHRGNKRVWRPDLWESENLSWEMLREGAWDKPVALEAVPSDGRSAKGLLERGWKVRVIPATGSVDGKPVPPAIPAVPPFPDLEIDATVHARLPEDLDAVMVRFGPDTRPADWLVEPACHAPFLVLEGPRDGGESKLLEALGYLGESKLIRGQWPEGGPHPELLHYSPVTGQPVGKLELLYLSREVSRDPAPVPSGYGIPAPGIDPPLGQEAEAFLRNRAREASSKEGTIMVVASIPATKVLAEELPDCRIVSVHYDLPLIELSRTEGWGHDIEFVHAPFEPPFPCMDLRRLTPETLQLLVAGAPREGAPEPRIAARPLVSWLALGSQAVSLGSPCESDAFASAADLNPVGGPDECAPYQKVLSQHSCISSEQTHFIYQGFVIQDPDGTAKMTAGECWKSPFGVVPLEIPIEDKIPWAEVNLMEDPDSSGKPRMDYVARKLAEKRAVVQALHAFLGGTQPAALIAQQDCSWKEEAYRNFMEAAAELPCDWDLLFLQVDYAEDPVPYSTRLAKLKRARGRLAVLWSRKAAGELLPLLEKTGQEWDALVQQRVRQLNCFCVVPMPAERQSGC